MAMLAIWMVSVGAFFGLLWFLAVIMSAVFPHDPPFREDDSTVHRLRRLHW